MKKFVAKFVREFEADIEAESTQLAEAVARRIVAEISGCKLLSIVEEGVAIEVVKELGPEGRTQPPRGTPPRGGTPGTPVVKQEILVDQIAKVA